MAERPHGLALIHPAIASELGGVDLFRPRVIDIAHRGRISHEGPVLTPKTGTPSSLRSPLSLATLMRRCCRQTVGGNQEHPVIPIFVNRNYSSRRANVKHISLMLSIALLFYAASTFASLEPTEAKARTKTGLYVTATEAYEMLTNQRDRKVVLIDVRDPVEIMFTGFTDMADINIPFKMIDPSIWDERSGSYQANTNRDFGADKDSDIIFMCRYGPTGRGPAADALHEAGYNNVYTMIDGFEGQEEKSGDHIGARVVSGWKNSGLPWGWKLNEEKMYVVIR